jgi:hypothetical protein
MIEQQIKSENQGLINSEHKENNETKESNLLKSNEEDQVKEKGLIN